jgi:uncharacterized protein DUF3995
MAIDSQTESSTRSRAGLPAAVVAAVLGVLYAALNFYWAAGGERWLDKYGSHLIGDAGAASFKAASAVLGVLFLVAVALGLQAVLMPFDASARTPVRWLAWVAAGLLALFGLGMTSIGLAVQFGIGNLAAADNPEVFRWHAFLWDPWYLVWGVVLMVALLQSGRAYVATGRKLI